MSIALDRREVLHSSRWKYGVAIALILVFCILVELLIITSSFDPVIPALIIILIIALIPVTIFIIDLYFCEL